jgi:hypothetical protein
MYGTIFYKSCKKYKELYISFSMPHSNARVITSFRYKLASILLCWKTNTTPPTTMVKGSDYSDGDPDDVVMSHSDGLLLGEHVGRPQRLSRPSHCGLSHPSNQGYPHSPLLPLLVTLNGVTHNLGVGRARLPSPSSMVAAGLTRCVMC